MQREISQSELRNRLYETFKHSGVENALKAQLRIQLVRILKKNALTPDVSLEAPLVIRAINSLFVDYLQHVNYQYTLSVFLPESGMSNQVLSRNDVLNVLHLEGDSKLLQNMRDDAESAENSESLILQLFKELGKLHPTKVDKDMQTDTPPETLDKKLRHLEDDFFMKSEAERSAPYRSLEERMIKYQRDCDERAKSEIQTEITRFKELELSRMRLEESGKFRELLNREREELEKRFNEKLEKLRQREQDTNDSLQKKEQDILKIDYDQRQKMMRDLEVIKGKENDFRREKEMFAKEMRMNQERFTEREEALNARLDEAHKIVDSMRAKFDADLELYKANYQKSLDDERQSVQRERAQLMEEIKKFEKDKEPHAKMFQRMWSMEEEAKINQQRLKISTDHCEHLNQKLKQMQDEVDRLTQLSNNFNVVRASPAPSAPPAIDPAELQKLKALLAQEQDARQRAERECAKLRASHAEAKGGFAELQELHDQEVQDMLDEHNAALQQEKNKFSMFEQELQKDKQRLKEELRTEVDIRNDLSRLLDERELELSRLKIQFGLPPVPLPYLQGGQRPPFMTPMADAYQIDPRFGMSQMQFQPKFESRPFSQDLPTNFKIPPQPQESDAWRMELNKTLNGIFELEKEDRKAQQKYYDMKSSMSEKPKREEKRVENFSFHNDGEDEYSEEEIKRSGKKDKKISKSKGEKDDKTKKEGKGKGGKNKENFDSNNEELSTSKKKPKQKEKLDKKKKGKVEESEEEEDEIDRKLREMEQREKEERERVERERKEREERHRKDKEELEKRERDIKDREDRMREESERQKQEDERKRLEQELAVLRKMKEEEEERRERDKREDDRRREREREREEEERRKRQERDKEREREMAIEAERKEREEKKAQELLSQIRERREKEQKKTQARDDSSFSDLDFGEVADILDDDISV